jgi:hypothetical protein
VRYFRIFRLMGWPGDGGRRSGTVGWPPRGQDDAAAAANWGGVKVMARTPKPHILVAAAGLVVGGVAALAATPLSGATQAVAQQTTAEPGRQHLSQRPYGNEADPEPLIPRLARRSICFDLIDWTGLHPTKWLRFHSASTAKEAENLYRILDSVPRFQHPKLRTASDRQSYAFVQLLSRVAEYRYGGYGWRPKREDLLAELKAKRRQPKAKLGSAVSPLFLYDHQWREKEQVEEVKKRGLALADEFDRLSESSPTDSLVAGYAALYGAILRLNWSEDFDSVSKRLIDIERGWQRRGPIAVMAAWYRAIGLAYYEMPDARDAFRHVAEQYRGLDWWVVKTAGELSKNKRQNAWIGLVTDRRYLRQAQVLRQP